MTALRTETVIVSNALCDIANAPAEVQQSLGSGLVRALGLVDRDFEDSKAAGYVEDLEAFAARIAKAGA